MMLLIIITLPIIVINTKHFSLNAFILSTIDLHPLQI